ncbi:putative RING-type E3 ubiquitin transferase C3H69 isoform X2 [Quercus robur]|uniref:putative RING-type E3 ubiquitin transferase C3H69 isoform X2 n=1 Tax=Quercus robur TaxID=38942 RepID=UPI002162BED8|nr:putative RING-type E3 ubiquitin transferase C3H69 isoform X2 [Quercus robur]
MIGIFMIFDFSCSCRVLCKFFARGACLKGEHCEFSHDWKDPPHNICTYYQKGLCAYDSRCRYEHVKASRGHSSASSSSTNARQMHVKVPESVGPLIASTLILGMETAHLGVVAFISIRSSQAHTLGDITGPLHEDLVLWMTCLICSTP